MVFSTFATMGVAANTAGFVDVTVNTPEMATALNVLRDVGVVRGITDTEFAGERPVTRAEFALFVARISTGRPGDFAPSTAALPFVRTMFSDLNDFDHDGVFAAAIQYGVENGIIQGFPDGTFRPNNSILFEEAVTMLTRALGYTGLSFPHGYLSRANESGVRLIGPFVLTRGFDFGAPGTTGIGGTVSRYDMAMLLYNFLLTDFNRLVSLWSGVLGRYEMVERRVPVLTNFGITPVIAYITGVENYAIDLRLSDYHPRLGGEHVGAIGAAGAVSTLRPFRFTGTPISPLQVPGVPNIRTPHDIEVVHGTTFTQGSAAQGAHVWNSTTGQFEWHEFPGGAATASGWATTRTLTTKEALGLPDRINEDIPDFMAARSWLGIRIIMYTRTAGAHRDVILPDAVVLGTRTLADNSLNDATFTVRTANVGVGGDTLLQPRVYNVESLTLDTGDGAITFNQTGVADLHINNIYAWRRDGLLVSGAATGNHNAMDPTIGTATTAGPVTHVRGTGGNGLAFHEATIDRQLAAVAANANPANYELWFVDNGLNSLGEREIFFEFIPFRVGYRYTNHTDNNTTVRFRDSVHGNLDLPQLNRTPLPGVALIAAPGVESIAVENAYLFTAFGRYTTNVVFREQLVAFATDVTIGGLTRPISATAYNPVSNVSIVNRGIFTFNRETGSQALGAIYSDSAVSRFAFGYGPDSTFTLFGRVDDITAGADNPILLVRRTSGGTPPVGRGDMRYVVVTSTAPGIAQAPGTNAVPNTQNIGGFGNIFGTTQTIVEVFDPIVGTNIIMPLSSGNATWDAQLANIRPGEYLAVRPNAGTNTWTWAPVTANTTSNQATVQGHLDSTPASPTGLNLIPGALTAGAGQATVRANAAAFEWLADGTTGNAALAGPSPNFSTATGRLELSGVGARQIANGHPVVAPATTPPAVDTTFLTASTRIIVFGSTTGWNETANDWAAGGTWTAQSFLYGTANAASVAAFLNQAYRVAVVTNIGLPNVASAEVVFISTLAPVGTPVHQLAGHYAVITSPHPQFSVMGTTGAGTIPVQFNIWQARVLGQDPIYVAIQLGTNVRRGQLVQLSATTHPINVVGGTQQSFRMVTGVIDDFVADRHTTLFGTAMGTSNDARNTLMAQMRAPVGAINSLTALSTAAADPAGSISRVVGAVTSFSAGTLVVGGKTFSNVSGNFPVIEFYNNNDVRFGNMSIHSPTLNGRLWRTYNGVPETEARPAYASNLNAIVWYSPAPVGGNDTVVAIVLIRARDRVNNLPVLPLS